MSRYLNDGLWLTEHRNSGKMDGFDSIMLSHPTFCQSRNCGVCGHCYSKRLSGYRPKLKTKQMNNSLLLSSLKYMPGFMTTINNVCRLSSFGELDNKNQYVNLIFLAMRNPHIRFVIWTKRYDIVARQLRVSNLKRIWSATKFDVQKVFVPEGFDKAFFVYTSEDKIPEGVFHCIGQCKNCMECYTGTSKIIGEIVK